MLNNLKSSYSVGQTVCKLQNPGFKSVLFFNERNDLTNANQTGLKFYPKKWFNKS